MCGIGLLVYDDSTKHQDRKLSSESFRKCLSRRGPDSTSEIELGKICFLGSVLRIQGDRVITQPYVDHLGNILLWNGEVFRCKGSLYEIGESDTVFISRIFGQLLTGIDLSECSSSSIASRVADYLKNIEGPYAFIYYHKSTATILFARDPIGRRSLLVLTSPTDNKVIALSSVIPMEWELNPNSNDVWNEVSVDGIYSFHFNSTNDSQSDSSQVHLHVWPEGTIKLSRPLFIQYSNILSSQTKDAAMEQVASTFLFYLTDAVSRRVHAMHPSIHETNGYEPMISTGNNALPCRIGVLFSGGIDSVLLAAVLHTCLPHEEAIDLINVTFLEDSVPLKAANESTTTVSDETAKSISSPIQSPDRLASIAALGELQVSNYYYYYHYYDYLLLLLSFIIIIIIIILLLSTHICVAIIFIIYEFRFSYFYYYYSYSYI